jgi:hypothetical protein
VVGAVEGGVVGRHHVVGDVVGAQHDGAACEGTKNTWPCVGRMRQDAFAYRWRGRRASTRR